MIVCSPFHEWVFVSHSSNDLLNVRKVRNYLEERGASPLLFHLLALKEPEEFWPIIEREISERNFFLYCESEAAEKSPWVQRERKAVESTRLRRPIRIGRCRVDQENVDTLSIDRFLRTLRVFPSFGRKDHGIVRPFLEALEQNGFMVFSLKHIEAGESWEGRITTELELAHKDGWVVVFLSESSIQSLSLQWEVLTARQLGARLVPVLIEKVQQPTVLSDLQFLDVTSDLTAGPQVLVRELLIREVTASN
jgi:TIR domain